MRPFRKTLSPSDIETFLEDPERYLDRVRNGYKRGETTMERIGESVHAVAAAAPEERDAVLALQLTLAPAEERTQLEKIVRERVKRSEEMAAMDAATTRVKEHLLKFFDLSSDWTLVAKPDEISEIDDGAGGTLLQITDIKNAYVLRPKHRRQVYYFGLALSLALGISRPIKLVVRLLGSGRSEVMWYSPKQTERKLEEVRTVIRRIEEFLKSVEGRQESQTDAISMAA